MTAEERHFSAREAADYCGVAEKTMRNWLRSGKIAADKSGGAFRIPASRLEPYRRHAGNTSAASAAPEAPGKRQPDRQDGGNGADVRGKSADAGAESTAPALLELIRLVAQLQRENRDLAGQIGYEQAMRRTAETRLLALEAPGESPAGVDAAHTRHASNPGGVGSETRQTPFARPTRPWWRFW